MTLAPCWDADAYQRLRALRTRIKAPWFTRPFDLNLVIARSNTVGLWDDIVYVAYTDHAQRLCVEAYPATGDASASEWTAPTNPAGCLYVRDQHVPSGFILGLHKTRKALVQAQPFLCSRWRASHGRVPTVAELNALPTITGVYAANLHNRVSNNTPTAPAPDDSEGCTVVLYQHHYASLLRLVELQGSAVGSTTVSPTFCLRSAL